MDNSIFLAKVLGLYYLIMAVFMMVHGERFRAMLRKIDTDPFIFLSGIIALLVGLLLVVGHNQWEASWTVLITLIGWIALVKGLVLLMFPEFAFKMIKKFTKNVSAYYISSAVAFILGGYLTYVSFMSA